MSLQYDRLEIFGEDQRCAYAHSYRERRRHTLELVQTAAVPGSRVLDVAAAQGNFSLALAELGYDVTWNDLRGELVDYVRLKHERGTIRFAPGNVFEIKANKPFDIVLIGEVIEHVAHPDEFLCKIAQLVDRGGHVVMTTPNGEYFRNHLPRFSDCPDPSMYEALQFRPNSDGHIFLLYPDEICNFAKIAGLEILETRYFGNPLTSGHVKLRYVLPVVPLWLVRNVEQATERVPRFLKRHFHSGIATLFRLPVAA